MTGRSAGGGGRTKSGKPRPGTGGYGKRKLEGKGPTPPAEMRPGHPAQRRAAAQAKKAAAAKASAAKPGQGPSGAGRSGQGQSGQAQSRPGGQAGRSRKPGTAAGRAGAGGRERSGPGPSYSRGAGSGVAELVAGRNPVLEALAARVPATALHVGPRLDNDERISQAVLLAANAGIPVVEAGRAELDRITGGAIHQGLALRIKRYAYADPADLVAAARAAADRRAGRHH